MKVAEVKQAKSRILFDKIFGSHNGENRAGCRMHQNDTGYWIPDSFIEHRVSKIPGSLAAARQSFFRAKGARR